MTLLYHDRRFLDHDTGRHPEHAERLRVVAAHLEQRGLFDRCTTPAWSAATRSQLERVHEPGYIDWLDALADQGGARLDPDTVLGPASPDVARLASGAACDAVAKVIAGEDRNAFCLVRPPGHHALAERAMGFCLFNHVAVAACAALEEHGLERLLIVDWDVHHGNGTQDTFYADGRVGYFSIHRWPFYPGTGSAEETGIGDGAGATLNVPVQVGTSRQQYMILFRTKLEEFAARIRPQLVLISAGFDAHREDLLGSFVLETDDFATLTRNVLGVADRYAGGRVVSVLEGGYTPPVLADCIAGHLQELAG